MSYYENKSKEYLKVAEMIHTQQFFSVVPHNAYYSCFLLMQHLFYNKYNEKFDIVKKMMNKKGTHEVIQSYLSKVFINNAVKFDEKKNFLKYNNELGQLKKLRIKADYHDVEITEDDSKVSISFAKDILQFLNTI